MSSPKSQLILPERKVEHLYWGQTTRLGGVSNPPFSSMNLGGHVGDDSSALRQNWLRFGKMQAWSRETIATCNQVHGDSILIAETGGHKPVDADALISLKSGLGVGVFTADCVPVLLADPVTKAVAAIHCGWKGASKQLASKTLDKLKALTGLRPENVLVWFGASIAQCSYQVGPEVVAGFGESLKEKNSILFESPRAKRDGTGKYLLDIARTIEDELIRAGIPLKNLEHADIDTFSRTDLVFSYRAESGKTGRMLSYVGFR